MSNQNTKERFTMLTGRPDVCYHVTTIDSLMKDVFDPDFKAVENATSDGEEPFITIMPTHDSSVFAILTSSSGTPFYSFIRYSHSRSLAADLAEAAPNYGFKAAPYNDCYSPNGTFKFTRANKI